MNQLKSLAVHSISLSVCQQPSFMLVSYRKEQGWPQHGFGATCDLRNTPLIVFGY
jgi:hypothetical protein